VNPATDELSRFLVLPNSASAFPRTLAIGDAVWVGQNNGALIKVDPRTDTRYQVETGYSIDQLAATKDHVWFADILEGALVPVDPGSLDVGRPVPVEGNLDQLEARGSFLWILERRDGVVTRVDAETGEVTGTARVGGTSMDMAVADDAVWVADLDGSLYRVDPSTLQVTTLVVGAEVLGVTVDHANDSLWVYVGEPTDS
jgi:streptogramin lyase